MALVFEHAGLLPFSEGRALQQRLVDERRQGARGDTILFCEHPATFSCGRRTSEHERALLPRTEAIEIVDADRGGSITYHGPGQLVIYPVIDLRALHLGVRSFVERGLEAISVCLKSYDICAHHLLDPAGVWVKNDGRQLKIASVGLRIDRGITQHGFSLNVNLDLAPFREFTPCSLSDVEMTSIAMLLPETSPTISEVTGTLQEIWQCQGDRDGNVC